MHAYACTHSVSHRLLLHSNYTCANIVFRPLFMTVRLRLPLLAAEIFLSFFCVCVCVWSSTGLLSVDVEMESPITERCSLACAWALWVVVWPTARLADGQSLRLFFLFVSFSGYLIQLYSQAPSLFRQQPPPFPLQITTFPLVNRGRARRSKDMPESQKNLSLSGCGMHMAGCKYAAAEAFQMASNKQSRLSVYAFSC